MKILLLDTYYEAVLRKFYCKFSSATTSSYTKTHSRLLNQLFGTADFYSANLRQMGHEAEDLIINDKFLQKKWAREHGQKRLFDWADGIHIPFTKIGFHSHWEEEILREQIKSYQPDILYCQNLFSPGPAFLTEIKKKSKIRVIGQIAFPIAFDKEFLFPYDLILTSFPHFVGRFQKLGIKSEYFRIGFEQSILSKLKKTTKQYSVTFVGSFSKRHNNETVSSVATDIWGHGNVPVSSKYHGEAWGKDMYNILYNSKITLNRHIQAAESHANNMRLFEATGVGTMLITDYTRDLEKLFVPYKEIETYRTKKELADKVEYYLSHEKERKKIAEAGQRRTLRDHTYKKRMIELVKILQRNNISHG